MISPRNLSANVPTWVQYKCINAAYFMPSCSHLPQFTTYSLAIHYSLALAPNVVILPFFGTCAIPPNSQHSLFWPISPFSWSQWRFLCQNLGSLFTRCSGSSPSPFGCAQFQILPKANYISLQRPISDPSKGQFHILPKTKAKFMPFFVCFCFLVFIYGPRTFGQKQRAVFWPFLNYCPKLMRSPKYRYINGREPSVPFPPDDVF